MKYIKKMSSAPLEPINGSVVDTFNVEDKTTNAPSVNLAEGLRGKILWANPNPTSEMPGGYIADLSSGDYDEYEVIYRAGILNNYLKTVKSLKGYGTILTHSYSSSLTNLSRTWEFVNDTQMYSGDPKIVNSSGVTINNTQLIPLYIIGYKTGLFN